MGEKEGSRKTVSADDVKTAWDAIVIGAGLGGMTAALSLARKGKKVLLLEQHFIPGGYATCFRRKGFTFEVSLHQTPGFGRGQAVYEILTEMGVMDRIKVIPLEETIHLKTPLGDLSMGPGYLEQLKALFPSEKKGLERLDQLIVEVLAELSRIAPLGYLPDWLYSTVGRLMAPVIYKLKDKTLAECLDEYTDNPILKKLLAVQWGYFGLPLERISAILYFTGWGGFLKEGIYYIKGTSQSLSNALVDRLEEEKGRLILSQKVESIIVEKGRAVGVVSRRTTGNKDETHEFRAPVIVSNSNPFLTFRELVEPGTIPESYLSEMDQMEISASASLLYVGLDCDFAGLSGESHHSSCFMDPEKLDMEEDFRARKEGRMRGFDGLTVYSTVDPDLAPPGKSCLSLLRVDFMRDWDRLTPEEYKSRKEALTEEWLEELEKQVPGIRSHIEVIESATPRTMKRYTLNHEGAFNGFAYTTQRVGFARGGLDAQTPLPGLYLASAWAGALSGGYAGCILNGYSTAMQILRTARWH